MRALRTGRRLSPQSRSASSRKGAIWPPPAIACQAINTNVAHTGMKLMTLELGGKFPQIVVVGADLDLAADAIARSILLKAT